jgi:hypothetical protein
MRLSANAKNQVHLPELSKAPKDILQPLPSRPKFARIQKDRDTRHSTLSQYLDSPPMDGPARRAGAGADGSENRSRRVLITARARLPPISSGKVRPTELKDKSKISCATVASEKAGGQNAGWATLHGGKGDGSGVQEGQVGGEGYIHVYTVVPQHVHR